MIIVKVYYILLFICCLYGAYFSISGIIGLLIKRKKFTKNRNNYNHFAIVIAARNEETVVGNLIESLKKLDYPKDKYSIFVFPNNCNDNTSRVALDAGASVIECNIPTKSKGDVLKFAFQQLKDNDEIDAYLVFDADNIVHSDFLLYMNDALNKGYNVAEGFRDSKNPTDNWISGSYTLFYLFQNIFFNRARMGINGSSSINGTGFMISKKLIDKNGFDTYTLTEDVEFTGQCALIGEKIAFVEDAITYDEYPNMFNLSWKQRKRWSYGIIQCMNRYSLKLLGNFFKTGNIASLDMAVVYLGPLIQVFTFITGVMFLCFNLFDVVLNDFFSYLLNSSIFLLGFAIFGVMLECFLLMFKKKLVKGMIPGIIMFTVFLFTWIPINIICFLTKPGGWEEIKHFRNIKIEEIEKK